MGRRGRLKPGGEPVGHGDQRDDRRDPGVGGGCGQRQATPERHSPQGNPVGVDSGKSPGERHGGSPVLPLAADRHPSSRLAAAVSPVAVVEGHHSEPGGGEPFRVCRYAVPPGQGDPVAHDHDGREAGG